jgi:hemoglobin
MNAVFGNPRRPQPTAGPSEIWSHAPGLSSSRAAGHGFLSAGRAAAPSPGLLEFPGGGNCKAVAPIFCSIRVSKVIALPARLLYHRAGIRYCSAGVKAGVQSNGSVSKQSSVVYGLMSGIIDDGNARLGPRSRAEIKPSGTLKCGDSRLFHDPLKPREGVYTHMRKTLVAVAIAVVFALGSLGPAAAAKEHKKKAPSLYHQLGGKHGIKKVVNDFVGNVANDGRINKFFADTAKDPKRLASFKGKLVDQICQASGGPCKYKGKDMKTAHKGMGITDADFNALVEDLVKALDSNGVSADAKNTLLGALGPMKGDIVGQ